MRGVGGEGLIEWAYLVVVATLAQAVVAGALLILLPLARIRRTLDRRRPHGAYFLLLGLAFLFVEIAFIQKFVLFLSHPLYSVAVVLAAFLLFAGVGSAASSWFARMRQRGFAPVSLAVAADRPSQCSYLIVLPPLFRISRARRCDEGPAVGRADRAARVSHGYAVPARAPAGRSIGAGIPALGLGINGFASVLSAVLATLLAIHFGFAVVIAIAILLYAGAATLRVA